MVTILQPNVQIDLCRLGIPPLHLTIVVGWKILQYQMHHLFTLGTLIDKSLVRLPVYLGKQLYTTRSGSFSTHIKWNCLLWYSNTRIKVYSNITRWRLLVHRFTWTVIHTPSSKSDIKSKDLGNLTIPYLVLFKILFWLVSRVSRFLWQWRKVMHSRPGRSARIIVLPDDK